MIRRPPRSTLFPTRRSSDLCATDPASLTFLEGLFDELLPNFRSRLFNVGLDETIDLGAGRSKAACSERSEEHTSELQSQFHLVCRLLLEKKKQNTERRRLRN